MKVLHICCCVLVLGGLYAPAAAQESQGLAPIDAGMNSSSPQQDNPRPRNADTQPAGGPPRDISAVDLATGELIRLEDLEGNSLVYGISQSQGYGWVKSQTNGNSEGSLSLVQPNLGVFHASRRTTALFQYAPTIDLYDGQHWDGGIFHNASADGYHLLSERMTLRFSGLFMGGSDAIRQIATLGIGGGNGGVDGLPYVLAKNSTDLFLGSTGLHWMRTPRQEVSVVLSDSFSSETDAPATDTLGIRAQISSDVGRRSRWRAYLHTDFATNDPDRLIWILGSGFTSTFWKHTTVDLEGGPQFMTGQRHGRTSMAFSGSLKQEVSSRTGLYLTAQRDFNVSYLGQSRWADEYSVRLRQQMSRSIFVRADVGYVHATDIDTGIDDRHGFYVGSQFDWHAADSVAFISSYRYFKRDNPASGIRERHNWVLGTLAWEPSRRTLHR